MDYTDIKSLFDSMYLDLEKLEIKIDPSLDKSDFYDLSSKTIYLKSPSSLDKKNRYLIAEAIVIEKTKKDNLSPMELNKKVREYILPDDERQFYNCYRKHTTKDFQNSKKYEKVEVVDITAMSEELFVSPMMIKTRCYDLGIFT